MRTEWEAYRVQDYDLRSQETKNKTVTYFLIKIGDIKELTKTGIRCGKIKWDPTYHNQVVVVT